MLMPKAHEYTPGQIIAFKLVNGDEIVAKVVSNTSYGWNVSKPCTVVPSHQGLGLVQSLFSADINKDIAIKDEHVMLHAPVIKELENHYIQTTTGIKPVTAGSIVV